MTVYINKATNKFMSVINSPFSNGDEIDILHEDYGFRFFYENRFAGMEYQKDDECRQEFISHLENLPLKLQVALDNLLLEDISCHYSSVEPKRDYYDMYQDYLINDCPDGLTPYEAQQDFLEMLKDGDLESPVDDFREIDGWSQVKIALNFLQDNLPDFQWWYVTGYGQGDLTYAWTFQKFDPEDFISSINSYYSKYSFDDFLTTTLYGSFVDIMPCDEFGNSSYDDIKIVADLCIADENNLSYHDQYVDEYMKKHYDMVPANYTITYYA